MNDDELNCYLGDAIKSLGDGRIAGYLVRFSSADTPDLVGDFFTKQTYLGTLDTLDVYYHHGTDPTLKLEVLTRAKITHDDVGAWAEAQLNLANEYQARIYGLVEAGKLGWSSGSAGHLVERESVGKAFEVKRWPLVEASLTPTPAEWRNKIVPLKSLITPGAAVLTKADADNTQEVHKENNKMDENELKTLVESVARTAAANALEEFKAAMPEVRAGYVEVKKDEADKAAEENPFKSGGEFLKAVIAAEQYGNVDKRLLPLKATGLNEAVPSLGGFLVPPQFASGILERMYRTGQILSRVGMDTITGNTMVYNAVDETSRGDGSRFGGVQSYWLAEGGTKVASRPRFRALELKLKKVGAMCYATDELIEDAGALESWLNRIVPEELRFSTEDAFIDGNSVGRPLGILRSNALATVTRENANAVTALDIARMWSRRWAGVTDYVWLINQDVFPQLVNLTLGNFPIYMPPGGVSAAPYGTIYGRPVLEVEYMPSLGTQGDITLAALSQYQAIGKSGIQAASSIHVQFVTDETAFRFVYRVDGSPMWNAPLTPAKGGNTQSPFVVLTASS